MSVVFPVKAAGGQEKSAASSVSAKAGRGDKATKIYSIVVLETMPGYVFFEASESQSVVECIVGARYMRGKIPGMIPFHEIEKLIAPKTDVSDLAVGDVVEIISGPFKGLRGKVLRVTELVTVTLLDAQSKFPVKVEAGSVKRIAESVDLQV